MSNDTTLPGTVRVLCCEANFLGISIYLKFVFNNNLWQEILTSETPVDLSFLQFYIIYIRDMFFNWKYNVYYNCDILYVSNRREWWVGTSMLSDIQTNSGSDYCREYWLTILCNFKKATYHPRSHWAYTVSFTSNRHHFEQCCFYIDIKLVDGKNS